MAPCFIELSQEKFTVKMFPGPIALPRPFTSDAPRLALRDLPRLGQSIHLAWQVPHALHATVTRAAAGLTIETDGSVTEVELRSWPMPATLGCLRGIRWRMVCPLCGASRDALHWHGEWGCRGKGCLNLAFPVRHSLRWCTAIRRRARLLRKLARVSPRSLRARAIRAQIAREEAAMAANLRRTNRDLAKRRQRYGRSGRADPSERAR